LPYIGQKKQESNWFLDMIRQSGGKKIRYEQNKVVAGLAKLKMSLGLVILE
jgi:hypothetical protein